ncbi:DUF6702 family protein [Haliscomenobacter hydrossis]|uniref:Uncharacterized protein n=1 Tax=Haliscomenobacter hydrossis (strain ATCC 27775 / DSM 1100 / LMG 10767 / O) TaxID=760192 RepID=F4KWG6_HALH1|nr:DUF6702 family protein [Haliscomenobacter hydrossis]AEE50316.1 hypothetical protein Halhy_2442 [Haliscomenobacter hydrossis DSM 1100]
MHILLLFLLFSVAPHPIHLTVMEIYRAENSKNLECSVTLFSDDFARAIQYETYAPQIQGGKLKVEDLMLKYLRSKLQMKINGKSTAYTLLRTENTPETITCYLKLSLPAAETQKIEIVSKLMLELFNDQRNLVQIRIPGKKEGAISLDKTKTESTATLAPD